MLSVACYCSMTAGGWLLFVVICSFDMWLLASRCLTVDDGCFV